MIYGPSMEDIEDPGIVRHGNGFKYYFFFCKIGHKYNPLTHLERVICPFKTVLGKKYCYYGGISRKEVFKKW